MPAASSETFSLPEELLALLEHSCLPHAVVLECRDKQAALDTALYLSRWAVCTGKEKPCGVCNACIKAVKNSHPDIYTAQTAGKTRAIPVDEIRKICMDAYIVPNEAPVKVYLLFDTDNMQQGAQNAFLKVLEEPPQNILFILTCENAENLLPTIRSRATVFHLSSTSSGQIQDIPAEQKAYALALQICQALYTGGEMRLLELTGALSDKAFAADVLAQLTPLLRGALVCSVTGNTQAAPQEAALCAHIRKQGLLNLLNVISTAQAKLIRNVNMALFCTWLCAAFRQEKNR